jgi:hypothetical protein
MRDDRDCSWLGPKAGSADVTCRLTCPLWRLRSADGHTVSSAGIYETPAGIELGVDENGELSSSELSRPDIDLMATAEELRRRSAQQGWIDISDEG